MVNNNRSSIPNSDLGNVPSNRFQNVENTIQRNVKKLVANFENLKLKNEDSFVNNRSFNKRISAPPQKGFIDQIIAIFAYFFSTYFSSMGKEQWKKYNLMNTEIKKVERLVNEFTQLTFAVNNKQKTLSLSQQIGSANSLKKETESFEEMSKKYISLSQELVKLNMIKIQILQSNDLNNYSRFASLIARIQEIEYQVKYFGDFLELEIKFLMYENHLDVKKKILTSQDYEDVINRPFQNIVNILRTIMSDNSSFQNNAIIPKYLSKPEWSREDLYSIINSLYPQLRCYVDRLNKASIKKQQEIKSKIDKDIHMFNSSLSRYQELIKNIENLSATLNRKTFVAKFIVALWGKQNLENKLDQYAEELKDVYTKIENNDVVINATDVQGLIPLVNPGKDQQMERQKSVRKMLERIPKIRASYNLRKQLIELSKNKNDIEAAKKTIIRLWDALKEAKIIFKVDDKGLRKIREITGIDVMKFDPIDRLEFLLCHYFPVQNQVENIFEKFNNQEKTKLNNQLREYIYQDPKIEEESEEPQVLTIEEEIEEPQVLTIEEEIEEPQVLTIEEEIEGPQVLTIEEEIEGPQVLTIEEESEEPQDPKVEETQDPKIEETQDPEVEMTDDEEGGLKREFFKVIKNKNLKSPEERKKEQENKWLNSLFKQIENKKILNLSDIPSLHQFSDDNKEKLRQAVEKKCNEFINECIQAGLNKEKYKKFPGYNNLTSIQQAEIVGRINIELQKKKENTSEALKAKEEIEKDTTATTESDWEEEEEQNKIQKDREIKILEELAAKSNNQENSNHETTINSQQEEKEQPKEESKTSDSVDLAKELKKMRELNNEDDDNSDSEDSEQDPSDW